MTSIDARRKTLLASATFAVLLVLAVPVVALRLFGYVFFLASNSTWVVIPALVLGTLCLLAARPFPGRSWIAVGLIVLYLVSVYMHGWAALQLRRSEGQSLGFDGLEALLILGLVVRCVVGGGAKSEPHGSPLT